MIKNKIKLSVNTGFAVNRIIDNETFISFVKMKLKVKNFLRKLTVIKI